MHKIEIDDATTVTRTINGAKGSFDIVEQVAWWFQPGEKHPTRIIVSLEKNAQPYAPGMYTISPDSFYVNRFNGMAMSLRLVKATARAAA